MHPSLWLTLLFLGFFPTPTAPAATTPAATTLAPTTPAATTQSAPGEVAVAGDSAPAQTPARQGAPRGKARVQPSSTDAKGIAPASPVQRLAALWERTPAEGHWLAAAVERIRARAQAAPPARPQGGWLSRWVDAVGQRALPTRPTPHAAAEPAPPQAQLARLEAPPELALRIDEREPAATAQAITFVGAGDIAQCSAVGYAGLTREGHELTADLIRRYPPDTPVFTLGDHVYSDGTPMEFSMCYDRSWGAFRDRTYPSVGNHEYTTDDAAPYFTYFGARAGDPTRGYYSTDLGPWHVIVLNSNCSRVSCAADSEQVQWLRADLAAHPTQCTLAYWHHPRWASDRVGDNQNVAPFIDALWEADADLVLAGHSHNYERMARMDPDGTPDPDHGIRELIVGTGGAELRPAVVRHPQSEVFESVFGILELSLTPDHYGWRFIETNGDVGDEGEDRCH